MHVMQIEEKELGQGNLGYDSELAKGGKFCNVIASLIVRGAPRTL